MSGGIAEKKHASGSGSSDTLCGVGLKVKVAPDKRLVVTGLVPDMPAFLCRQISVGDIIFAIDDHVIESEAGFEHFTRREAFRFWARLLLGQEHTRVVLHLHRNATAARRGKRFCVALYRALPHEEPDAPAGMPPGGASVGAVSGDDYDPTETATMPDSQPSAWLLQELEASA